MTETRDMQRQRQAEPETSDREPEVWAEVIRDLDLTDADVGNIVGGRKSATLNVELGWR
jgi:hypothetical protein